MLSQSDDEFYPWINPLMNLLKHVLISISYSFELNSSLVDVSAI